MKHLPLLLLIALSPFTSAQEAETEVEWKIIAKPNDLTVEDAAATFLEKATAPVKVNDKEKAELKRLKDLVSGKQLKLVPKDLLKLKKVRSIQIGQYGVFSYPYFNCRFKNTDRGVSFEKTSGSQRRSGTLFQNDPHTLVFLGSWTVNDEPKPQYSGFTRNKDTSHDSAGIFIKRGNTFLAIFPKKNNRYEIYEFK